MFKNAIKNFTSLGLLFSMCMPYAFSLANQAEEICVYQDTSVDQPAENSQKQEKLNEMAIELY